jgi:hypothetical protein
MEIYIINGVSIELSGSRLSPDASGALEAVLDDALERIRKYSCVEEASCALDELAGFQERLAMVVFKWDMELPYRLRQLVRVYDRSDDKELKQKVFVEIKAGRFLALKQ